MEEWRFHSPIMAFFYGKMISGGLQEPKEKENGNPLQYPCLENLMDRGAWWAAVHGVAKSRARMSD